MSFAICHRRQVICHAYHVRARNCACSVEASSLARTLQMNAKRRNTTRNVSEDIVCPRFDHCSAPICPLDNEWRGRHHLKGEPVCYFMRMHAKNALDGLKGGSVSEGLIDRVVTVFQDICDRYAPLKVSLQRAAQSQPRGFEQGGGR